MIASCLVGRRLDAPVLLTAGAALGGSAFWLAARPELRPSAALAAWAAGLTLFVGGSVRLDSRADRPAARQRLHRCSLKHWPSPA